MENNNFTEATNMERLQNLIDSLRDAESTLEGRASLQSLTWAGFSD